MRTIKEDRKERIIRVESEQKWKKFINDKLVDTRIVGCICYLFKVFPGLQLF